MIHILYGYAAINILAAAFFALIYFRRARSERQDNIIHLRRMR